MSIRALTNDIQSIIYSVLRITDVISEKLYCCLSKEEVC